MVETAGAGVDDPDRGLARPAARASQPMAQRLDGEILGHLGTIQRRSVAAGLAEDEDLEDLYGKVIDAVAAHDPRIAAAWLNR